MPDSSARREVTFHIDAKPYLHATGPIGPAQVRHTARPPISDDKQIWLDIDDAQDRVLAEDETVDLQGDLHFFSDFPAITLAIDRETYEVYERKLTGAQLRTLPSPDVAADRDLWLDVPDARDRKIQDEEVVILADGMRFFTAPGRINPGRHMGVIQ